MNQKLKIIGIWLAVILLAFVAKTLLLGGRPYVGLPSAAPLSGAISESLASSTDKTLPQINKDYRLLSANYFDSRIWAVCTITLPKETDNASIVLRQIDGVYRVVLGPGTAFSNSQTLSLPADVISYLKNSGVLIYQPVGDQ